MNPQLKGIESLEGTYLFDLERSAKALRLNRFLHGLTVPEKRDLFREGFASISNDAEPVGEALKRPGVVLRRAYGSKDPFREDPALPKLKGVKKSTRSAAADRAKDEERKRQAEFDRT